MLTWAAGADCGEAPIGATVGKLEPDMIVPADDADWVATPFTGRSLGAAIAEDAGIAFWERVDPGGAAGVTLCISVGADGDKIPD